MEYEGSYLKELRHLKKKKQKFKCEGGGGAELKFCCGSETDA